ncbi:MAG: alpha/beta hydrolase [Burkholderiales bacterium]|nr:alpha/beta hydrolase [Burkholderiales bacterium]ODU67347.1 MAG: hypothetical protein ABT05_03890 [Lautropia sp. SCN 66-9]
MKAAAREFVSLPVPPGTALESQSGLQMNWPRVYGVLGHAAGNRVAAIVMHPASNFMGHYLVDPLAARGVDLLALNSRYVNNDSTLIMERVIQDLGAGVRMLRERGYAAVYLIGNSGGAALCAFYQAQAEDLTITDTPAGDPVSIEPAHLPPVDGIALNAAHLGRSQLLRDMLDASVIDESDPLAAAAALDIYAADRSPPFDDDFVQRVRTAQANRMDRITARVQARLAWLRETDSARDEAFIVHRTYADPRYIDLHLDANDRQPGGNRGDDARSVNYGPNCLGRFCTLTSWLSQWSPLSRADGPANLQRTTVPVLQIEHTADGSVFPSTIARWSRAAEGRVENLQLKGGNHYLKGQEHLVAQAAAAMADWMSAQAR